MKEFLSNAWVVSIISGILVFFITNSIIMLQNRRKHKKQIKDANIMILNRLRGYVVDNGLPPKEIINAVKSSTAREYNIKPEDLLSIKEFCEELITDIVGNIYISNDNKVKYINILHDYLKQNSNFNNLNLEDNISPNTEIALSTSDYVRKRKKLINFMDIAPSIILTVLTTVAVFLSSNDITEVELNKFDIYAIFVEAISVIMIPIMIIFILPILKDINQQIRKAIRRMIKRK